MRLTRSLRGGVTLIALAMALGLAGAGWYLFAPRHVTSGGGTALGRLPSGVRSDELNVLLVTLDTTRADRIGAYGFTEGRTPVLDRMAREGVLFERAIAPAPLTMPAHSSIFTAKYPPEHGVRDNGGFFLDEQEVTLAERLKERGFKTGGFVGAYVLDRKWGIGQGFETYFDDFESTRNEWASLADVQRPANEVADRALGWLETVASSRFFAWVHFYDPHSPYVPPEPYKSQFPGRPYIGEIAFSDSEVGRLIAFLEERDLLKKTIVIVMGDHGESLGEHGESSHGFFVYEEVVHVPLILRSPFAGTKGRRVADVVRSIDVTPTVLDLLGMPAPADVRGRSVVPLMTGARRDLGLTAYSEAMYPRFHYGWSDLRSLTEGRFKYISAPRPELYDLEQDPEESRNLYADRRALADRMAAALQAIAEPATEEVKPAVEVDPDARARLAALGYVGTFVTSPVRDASSLADPKDKIDIFNLITDARDLLRDKDDLKSAEKGLDALRDVVSRDPEVIDAWLMIGNEYSRRGELEAAIEQYKRALALKPDYDLAVMNMAKAYRLLGRDQDAMVGYRRLLELNPRNAQARYEMAQILIDAGELGEAETELTNALADEPALAAARGSLGAVRLKQGRAEEGEREIRAALEQKSDLRLAHFNLALIAEQRGDLQAAIREYKKEIELQPKSHMAQFNLGKLYEQLGDRQAQLQAFRQAIESDPDFAEGHLFLAKLYLDLGQQLDEAVRLARRGMELAPTGEFAPLGHFVIADAYARQGRPADAAREAERGRALQSRLKARKPAASP